MAHTKAMGIGAMFVLLVVAVILLPIIVRYIDKLDVHYTISGFQDHSEGEVSGVPPMPASTSLSYPHDPNTDYNCRSPHAGGEPCPEGTFCDGYSQKCVKNYVGGPVPTVGYYS